MNNQTEELLNARVGGLKYKHVLLIDSAFIAFTAYLYVHQSDNLFFLLLIVVNVCVALLHYKSAKARAGRL